MLLLQLAVFLFFGLQPIIPSPPKIQPNTTVLAAHTALRKVPTPTPNPSPKPIITVIIPSTQPTISPASTKVPVVSDEEKKKFIMDRINEYRQARSLGPVVPNSDTCSFADVRAKEIASDFSHTGFTMRINNHTLPYAHYSFVTENLAETGDYRNVENLWSNSPGHAKNMQADTPYVCIGIYGNFYAYEGLKP